MVMARATLPAGCPRTVNRLMALYCVLLAGSWGAHKFLLGARREGWIYLVLSWTAVPMLASLADFVSLLRQPALGEGCGKRRLFARLPEEASVVHRSTLRRLGGAAIALLLVAAFSVEAREFTDASQCVVGTRVLNRDNQAGTIDSADGSSCRVRLDATGRIDYNIFWMLRPEPAAAKPASPAPSASAGAAGEIPNGLYKCHLLVGSQLSYAFIDIQVDGPGSYRDQTGAAGTYALEPGDRIRFTGPLARANAKLIRPGPRIGVNMDGGSFFNTSCSRCSWI
jgi:hypothetical protein